MSKPRTFGGGDPYEVPPCLCGHSANDHENGTGQCIFAKYHMYGCDCKKYRVVGQAARKRNKVPISEQVAEKVEQDFEDKVKFKCKHMAKELHRACIKTGVDCNLPDTKERAICKYYKEMD